MAARVYGYARVSTDGQDVQRQIDDLVFVGVDPRDVVVETASGVAHRPQLEGLIKQLYPGDSLVVTELSRLGRSTAEVLTRMESLDRDGIRVVVTTLSLDLATPAGRLVAATMAAVSQLERDLMRQRTRSALASRKAAGVKLGRPRALTDEQVQMVRTLHDGGMGVAAVARQMGCSPATVRRALAPADVR